MDNNGWYLNSKLQNVYKRIWIALIGWNGNFCGTVSIATIASQEDKLGASRSHFPSCSLYHIYFEGGIVLKHLNIFKYNLCVFGKRITATNIKNPLKLPGHL